MIKRLSLNDLVCAKKDKWVQKRGFSDMSKSSFRISINPIRAFQLVKNNVSADVVHEEINELGDEKYISILIFEKYYMRVSNRAGLVVILDNTKGNTEVRIIATASSQGVFFNFDWGAGDAFADSVREILQGYII